MATAGRVRWRPGGWRPPIPTAGIDRPALPRSIMTATKAGQRGRGGTEQERQPRCPCSPGRRRTERRRTRARRGPTTHHRAPPWRRHRASSRAPDSGLARTGPDLGMHSGIDSATNDVEPVEQGRGALIEQSTGTRLRSAPARPPGRGGRGGSRRFPLEAAQPRPDEAVELDQLRLERCGPKRGEPVWPPAFLRLEGLDQASPFKPGERPVQRPGAHRRPGDRLDVGHDRVAVLRPVRQRDEDVQGTARQSGRVLRGHWSCRGNLR